MRFSFSFLGILCMISVAEAKSAAGTTSPKHFPSAPGYCQYYPHWKDCETNTGLQKLENFLQKYPSELAAQSVVAFDWDGTLYNEHLKVARPGPRSGQSVWHIWGGEHLAKYPADGRYNFLFPSFKQFLPGGSRLDYQGWADAVAAQDNYLENQFSELSEDTKTGAIQTTGLPQGVYDKFSQIATMEAGMTFGEFRKGVNGYLSDYPAKDNAFTKMFDILHRLEVQGFKVWIITGSNPYFISNVITGDGGVNQMGLGYSVFPRCQAWMQSGPESQSVESFFAQCPIAGNGAVWSGYSAPFALQYDARNFNTLGASYKMAIDRYGKWFAAQHIMQTEGHHPIVLYAGNSNGDWSLMSRVLTNKKEEIGAPQGTFGIFVQPAQGSDFRDLMEKHCQESQCLDVEDPQ